MTRKLAPLPAWLTPTEPMRRLVVSGTITRIELHIPSVSEKNLQSIRAMGKVSPLVESAMKDLLKTSDLGRADFMYFTLPDGIRNHIRRPVDAPIAHFCIATASKLKKLLESSPIRGDRLVKARDRDPVRL